MLGWVGVSIEYRGLASLTVCPLTVMHHSKVEIACSLEAMHSFPKYFKQTFHVPLTMNALFLFEYLSEIWHKEHHEDTKSVKECLASCLACSGWPVLVTVIWLSSFVCIFNLMDYCLAQRNINTA